MFIITLLLSACGSDDKKKETKTEATKAINFSDIDVRKSEIGDSMSVEMTMEFVTGDYAGVTVKGNLSHTVDKIKQNPFGLSCLRTTLSGTLSGVFDDADISIPLISRYLGYQDDDGSIYDCGGYAADNISEIFIEETADSSDGVTLGVKYPAAEGHVTSAITHYLDGSWRDCTKLVIGEEAVTVPAGTFEAFKLEVSCTDSAGAVITSVGWYSPEISMISPVKHEVYAEYANGEHVKMNTILLDYIHAEATTKEEANTADSDSDSNQDDNIAEEEEEEEEEVIDGTTGDVHIFKIGDMVSADLKYEYLSGEHKGEILEGEYVQTVDSEVENPYNVTCLRSSVQATMSIKGDPESAVIPIMFRALFYQDVSGSEYSCGGYEDDQVTPKFIQDSSENPSGVVMRLEYPMEVGSVSTYVEYYSDDDWEDCTSSVVAKEIITVPAGKFNTFKIQASCIKDDGDTSSCTSWVAPSVSMFPVKEICNMSDDDGLTEGTRELKSYSYGNQEKEMQEEEEEEEEEEEDEG